MTTLNKILAGALIIVAALLIWEFYHAKKIENKLAIENQNKMALLDTVRLMKTKNGELESAKLALAGSKKDLEKLNSDLAAELKKEKGNVRVVTKIEIEYRDKPDSSVAQVITQDSTVQIRTDKEDSCQIFKGHVSFNLLKGKLEKPLFVIEKNEFNLNLVTGLRENKDKQLEIFARSTCPDVSIRNIQGAVIDPNDPLIKPKKPWFTWWDAVEIAGGLALGWFAHSK